MTDLKPQPTDLPPTARPRRLSLVTIPLLISLAISALYLLVVPFLGPHLNEIMTEYDRMNKTTTPPLPPELVNTVLWTSFFFLVILILWLYNTYRALLLGKSWGRVSAIVIAVFSLLNFPIGTILGVLMLVGLFDREVTSYTSR